MPDKDGSQKFAHDNSTKAPEVATTGAGIGLLAGGALGWLVGLGIPEYEAKRYKLIS
jgi:sugar/nucleoside kinase (ribokinase family)